MQRMHGKCCVRRQLREVHPGACQWTDERQVRFGRIDLTQRQAVLEAKRRGLAQVIEFGLT